VEEDSYTAWTQVASATTYALLTLNVWKPALLEAAETFIGHQGWEALQLLRV